MKNKFYVVLSMALLQGANAYGAAADADTAADPRSVVATPSAEPAATERAADTTCVKLGKRKPSARDTAAAPTNTGAHAGAGAGSPHSIAENPHSAPAIKRSCQQEGIHGDVGAVSPTLESDAPAPSASAAAPVLTHQDWRRLGEECYRANNYKGAMAWFDKIIENPYYIAAQSTGFLCHMGRAYRKHDQYSKAISCYAQAIAKQGGLEAVKDVALLYYAGICNFKEAMRHVGTDKHMAHIDNALTLLAQCLKRQETEIFTPDDISKNTPRYALFLQSTTALARTIERKQHAGVAVDPIHIATAGLAYYQVSKYAEAANRSEEAIAAQTAAGTAVSPTDLFIAGASNSMLENHDKAAVFFDRAIAHAPIRKVENNFLLGAMAQTYVALNKIEAAASAGYHYYIKVGPAPITKCMWPYIAHYYFKNGDYPASLRIYNHYFKIIGDVKVADTMNWAIREAIAARHISNLVDTERKEKPKAPRKISPLAPIPMKASECLVSA